MADKIRLGAIDSETKQYVNPWNATKDKQYECVDCGKRVFLRKGNIRAHHFAHYSQTNTCNYYEHPNEAQIHKDAKLLLQKLLNDKRLICMTWECSDCGGFYAFSEVPTFQYKDGDQAILEYRDKEGKWIADVALVNNGEVRYIFEIKNTHKTFTPRPEPWFEIEANSFIKYIQELFEEMEKEAETYSFRNEKDYIFEIPCIRNNLNRKCYGSFCYKEPWVRRIPGYYKDRNNNSCIICNIKDYEPQSDGCTGKFQNGYIRVCTNCLYQDIYHNKIRALYSGNIERKKEIEWSKNGKLEIQESTREILSKVERAILNYVPKLSHKRGMENEWSQEISCFECKRINYNPVFYRHSFYAICKICLGNNTVQENILKRIKDQSLKTPDEYLMLD